MNSHALPTDFQTGKFSLEKQFSEYADLIRDAFGVPYGFSRAPGDLSSRFTAGFQGAKLGPVMMCHFASQPHICIQQKDAAQSDTCCFNFFISGSGNITQLGRSAYLTPGSFSLVSSDQQARWHLGEKFEEYALTIPTGIVQAQLPDFLNFRAEKLPFTPNIRLLLSMWGTVSASFQFGLPETVSSRLGDTVLALLEAALSDITGVRPKDSPNRGLALETRLKNFIRQNQADPSLTPEKTAASEGISVRTLHSVFSRNGTSFGDYLWTCRLETAERLLRNPSLKNMPLEEIALRCGFRTLAHFSRRFKEHCGFSPRSYRQREMENRSEAAG